MRLPPAGGIYPAVVLALLLACQGPGPGAVDSQDTASCNPDRPEICDGLDQDCDGRVDEEAVDAQPLYLDQDGDGWGLGSSVERVCEPGPQHTEQAGDCDDQDPEVRPEAPERCNDVDDDCDGSVDEEPSEGMTLYPDQDGDAWGLEEGAFLACAAQPYSSTQPGDCDDTDVDVHPDAQERCDEVDWNCDGDPVAEAEEAELWYADADGDTWGDPDAAVWSCESELAGHSRFGEDCDDTERSVYPGSHTTEVPGDGVDVDCDGLDACTDLDCDGWPDLVLPSRASDGETTETVVWLGGETGLAKARRLFLEVDESWFGLASDLDGDGYVELLLCSQEGDSQLYEGRVEGPSDEHAEALPSCEHACVGDLDGDGLDDLALVQPELGSSVVFGDGSSQDLDLDASYVSCVDLDGDGLDDLLASSREGGTWQLLAPEFDSEQLLEGAAWMHHVEDLDGDGLPELIVPESEQAWVAWSDGSEERFELEGGRWAAVEDLDGDGLPELALASRGEDADTRRDLVIYAGTSSGFDRVNPQVLSTRGAHQLGAADLDGDGLPELIVSNPDQDGSWNTRSQLFDGASGFLSQTSLPTKGAAHHAVFDFDLDGDLDLVFSAWRDKDGYEGQARLYENEGSFGARVEYLDGEGMWGPPIVVGAR